MRRSARIGSIVAGIAAGAVAGVWLLKDRILGPEAKPVTPEEAPRFRVAPSTATAHDGDDLTEVKGIGPVYRARLGEGGVASFASLASADPASVAEMAGVGEDTAAEWIAQASALST